MRVSDDNLQEPDRSPPVMLVPGTEFGLSGLDQPPAAECLSLRSFPVLLFQLTCQDKAPSVVQRALEKHNVPQPWARDYQLFQVLPGDRGKHRQPELGLGPKGSDKSS